MICLGMDNKHLRESALLKEDWGDCLRTAVKYAGIQGTKECHPIVHAVLLPYL